jgi:large repetitive protein
VNVVVGGAYGTMWEDTATVTVVGGGDPPLNEAPVAADDSYSVNEGDTLSVPAPGVLANDTDPDGDPLTAALHSAPTGGNLILNGDGSFNYTPSQGTTSDSFTYTASDGTAVSAPATVTIGVVASGNQPPVAVDDSANTKRNVSVFINMAANDSDPDGNLKDASGNVSAGQFTIVTSPTKGGKVEVVTNGVNFTPRRNFTGTDVFTYTVSDLNGAVSNEATVTVNVTR